MALGLAVAVAGTALPPGCAREPGPEEVSLAYARALYSRDSGQAYRLVSSEDRRVKDEPSFRRGGDAPTGFALEAARQLAAFIEVSAVTKSVRGAQATVKLRLKLPNANAPEVATLLREWDAEALNALSERDREMIRVGLDGLHLAGTLPTLEAEEAFELVREPGGWRIRAGRAEGIRVRFRTRIVEGLALRAVPEPQELLVAPWRPAQMTVRLANSSAQDLLLRVGHVVEPEGAGPSLVFLQCPLLFPVRLRPNEERAVPATLMVPGDAPARATGFQVTYAIRRAE